MQQNNVLAGLVVLVALLAAREASPQQTVGALGSRPSAVELATRIDQAAADQLFAVHVEFARPVSVGEIRAVSAQLEISRVLAFVEHDRRVGGVPRGIVIIGLGEMYATSDAGRHSECLALMMVSLSETTELQTSPIETWPVAKIHVYATAHAIRELVRGRLSPPATVLDGSAAEPEHLRKLAQNIRSEASQPITPPSSIDLPADCARFVGPMDTPVLSGEVPPDISVLRDGETFRDRAFRVLASLPRDTAFTISLKLDFPATVEVLAALVDEYDIEGLRAELVPERSSKRVIADAQLSTYGAKPDAQIHRVRCQTRLGGEEPQASSEWYADWISVSLSAEAAARFLSYPNLAQAQVEGVYPLADLERLRGYYERLADRIYEMPTSIEIPVGCEDVYVHNDELERGSITFVRPTP